MHSQIVRAARSRPRSVLVLPVLAAIALTPPAPAQTGAWSLGFNHENNTANSNNCYSPFSSNPGNPLHWRVTWPTPFNAIHMALIPKGPHRGKVIVWGEQPLLGLATPYSGEYWSFQAWSIVDPAAVVAPGSVRFNNFLLPINSLGASPGPGSRGGDFFCAGHAWSPFGDLVVAGGTFFDINGQHAADLLYLFDPAQLSQPFPQNPPST